MLAFYHKSVGKTTGLHEMHKILRKMLYRQIKTLPFCNYD